MKFVTQIVLPSFGIATTIPVLGAIDLCEYNHCTPVSSLSSAKTMVKAKVATLKSDDSFQSLGTISATASANSDEENQSSSSAQELLEENERLRAEIAQLKLAMSKLQGKAEISLDRRHPPQSSSTNSAHINKQQQQQRHSHNQSISPKLVLELPQTLRRGSQPNNGKLPINCCARKTSKEDHSATTDDDQETVEPEYDVEAHESSRGLHHRSAHHSHPSPSRLQPKKKVVKMVGKDSTELRDSWDEEDDDDNSNEEGNLLIRRTGRQQQGDARPVAPFQEESFIRIVQDRAGWLVGLLVLQSMSSFILARNEELLEEHMVIIRFLTMLVGAGGNAGNQASVRGKFFDTF